MSLQIQINDAIKTAMKAKDSQSLEALRAVKSAILLALTEEKNKTELTDEEGVKILQRLVKQRKDSAEIYTKQGREDLAEPELSQAKVIEQFLPKQLSEQEVEEIVAKIIEDNNFSGMASMGQLMGLSTKAMSGQADGKTISTVVKKLLSAQ